MQLKKLASFLIVLAGLVTASVSAWWAYRRQCRAVFKDPA